ncbi:MAG: shikimate kinase [Armatimonadetes bacterium]|nr:shikimate kinase [Armatimonadota bacterium]
MNIVLIGFMGTGKSAVGRALARRLDARFLDADAEIERGAGRPIARIFAEEGEAAFRAMETALLDRLVSDKDPLPLAGEGGPACRDGWGPLVLATGGGMPLREENAVLLRRIGPVVWLTAPADVILQRVGPDLSLRPLLAAYQADPLTRITDLLAERGPRYAAIADLIWDTARHATPDEAAAALADELCRLAAQPRPAPAVTA